MYSRAKLLQRFGAVHGDIDQPSAALEARFERGPHPGIVIGDKDALHSAAPAAGEFAAGERVSEDGALKLREKTPLPAAALRGSRGGNVPPSRGRLSAPTNPPCCSSMRRKPASPSPELPARVLNP